MSRQSARRAWTRSRDDTLRKSAAMGDSMGQVAKKLGCTRNAVAARSHRLGVRFTGHLYDPHKVARAQ